METKMKNKIIFGDNLNALKTIEDKSIDLIYIDPPFNTGKEQKRNELSFDDKFDNFIDFIKPRIIESKRILRSVGSFFIHVDYREVHYCKILIDKIFGRKNFINEIIWSYDYGGRPKNRWPTKHDNILWYAMDSNHYTFNYDEIDRIPYMAPGLVGPEKAARGKTPTDVWWNTIVPTNGKEKTGYPTQKPLSIIERIIKVHTNPGDIVLDFFAGSGTTGEACARNNRNFILIDNNYQAIEIIRKRLSFIEESIEESYRRTI
jgi:site-specific DNA-methyltransferase (adenine-specific)